MSTTRQSEMQQPSLSSSQEHGQPSARPAPRKRQPSLLPAFEPASSPSQINSLKRKYEQTDFSRPYYPTPVPTSSTGILPSSPQQNRPALHRTVSCCSERAPLASVQTVNIPANGETVLLGRSSNSCHFQLPYNKLISRVHVSIRYEVAEDTSDALSRIVIECLGWNGCQVHCEGRVHQLTRGESYVAAKPLAAIILDIHDSRVAVAWPTVSLDSAQTSDSDELWEEPTPSRRATRVSPFHDDLRSSPPPLLPQSPISPSPMRTRPSGLSHAIPMDSPIRPSVQIYEDPVSARNSRSPQPEGDVMESFDTVKETASFVAPTAFMSSTTNASSDRHGDDPEENEENDPIVHSFGPFGSNILNRLNSFTTDGELGSPERPLKRKKPLGEYTITATSSPRKLSTENILQDSDSYNDKMTDINDSTSSSLSSEPTISPIKKVNKIDSNPEEPIQDQPQTRVEVPLLHRKINKSPIKNHIINQLAFSRIHAVPLSTIHSNLPEELRKINSSSSSRDRKEESAEGEEEEEEAQLTNAELKALIDETDCVGEIERSGKDAAGKELENEFYYVPEKDENSMRRAAVLGGRGGTGLRAVRRTHKQYYWKKPRV